MVFPGFESGRGISSTIVHACVKHNVQYFVNCCDHCMLIVTQKAQLLTGHSDWPHRLITDRRTPRQVSLESTELNWTLQWFWQAQTISHLTQLPLSLIPEEVLKHPKFQSSNDYHIIYWLSLHVGNSYLRIELGCCLESFKYILQIFHCFWFIWGWSERNNTQQQLTSNAILCIHNVLIHTHTQFA